MTSAFWIYLLVIWLIGAGATGWLLRYEYRFDPEEGWEAAFEFAACVIGWPVFWGLYLGKLVERYYSDKQ